MTSDRPKRRQGFATMTPERQREIASMGGKAAHKKGTAHEWTSEEARAAGRKGGAISRGGRGKLSPKEATIEAGMEPRSFESIVDRQSQPTVDNQHHVATDDGMPEIQS